MKLNTSKLGNTLSKESSQFFETVNQKACVYHKVCLDLNIKELNDEEIITNYSKLCQIEKTFRMSKTDLRIRPIYHRLRNRIEAHIYISFVAYS